MSWEFGTIPEGSSYFESPTDHDFYGVSHLDTNALVAAVGVRCHLGQRRKQGERRSWHIVIEEFIELSDRSRVTVHTNRGVTIGWAGESGLSATDIYTHVGIALLPDEAESDDEGEPRAWHGLSELIGDLGIRITPAELRRLPHRIDLTPALADILTGTDSEEG